MMKSGCIHPEILAALSKCGHGDRILIADGNYPLAQRTGNADKVYLGLVAGQPTVTDVLAALQEEIVIEAATVMEPAEGEDPAIFAEFQEMLPGLTLGRLGRFEFYDSASEGDVRLAISTGEKRTYANLLLTVGVA